MLSGMALGSVGMNGNTPRTIIMIMLSIHQERVQGKAALYIQEASRWSKFRYWLVHFKTYHNPSTLQETKKVIMEHEKGN